MGFNTLTKITKMGIPATYWEINEIIIKDKEKSVTIRVAGYMSLKAFENKSQPIEIIDFNIYSKLYGDEEIFEEYFSRKALKEAAIKGEDLYDVAYRYIATQDPDLQDYDISCDTELCLNRCCNKGGAI